MPIIQLSRGYQTEVDEETYAWAIKFKWHAVVTASGPYARRSNGLRKPCFYLHREIMGNPKEAVDHKDRNSLNNNKWNLRLATGSQNNQNAGPTIANTTGYKGVTLNSDRLNPKRFKANIGFERAVIFIGYYHTAEEAALAYDKKARELYGKDAYQNIKVF